jgi:chemotaxis protein CheD
MTDARPRVDVFLAPGDLTVHVGPVQVKTILGSCVAVCLWDAARGVGGVNHFLLPRPGQGDVADNRFGAVATRRLIEEVCAAGARRAALQAAVVGGGRPMSTITVGAVGDLNTAVALVVLREHGIRVVRQETGGAHGRKLLFNTQTGALLVRRVRGWAEVHGGGGPA